MADGSEATPGASLDSHFYISIIVLRVQSTVFRVPRKSFEVVGTTLPAEMDNLHGVQGSSDENPIVLKGVDARHFRGFLGAMYPFCDFNMTNDAWLGALKLATMWKFRWIRCQAITVLDPYVMSRTAKDAVLLAKKYHVAKWLMAAYTRILQAPLKIEALLQTPALDWETIARLLYAKQLGLFPSGNATYYCTLCGSPVRGESLCTCKRFEPRIGPSIEESFRIEFEGADPPLPVSRPTVVQFPGPFSF